VDLSSEVHESAELSAEGQEALDRFEELYRPEPTRARRAAARHDAALVYLWSGRLAAAERELREAVDLDPNEVDHRLALAEVLESQLKTDESKRVLEETATRFPDDARAYEALGDLYTAHDEHVDAKLAYLRALATEPDVRWSVELKVGETFQALGDRKRALEFFRAAHAHAPDEPWTTILLVQALRTPALSADGDPTANDAFRESLAIVDDAVRRVPPNAPLLVCAAQSFLAAGRYYDALDALRQAVELDPDDPTAVPFLAELERDFSTE
jgi:tetratricopeptide (TPR) repeat protein